MAFEVQTLKELSAAMGGEILLRYRLSGNTHPGSAKVPRLRPLSECGPCLLLKEHHPKKIPPKVMEMLLKKEIGPANVIFTSRAVGSAIHPRGEGFFPCGTEPPFRPCI
jgi:hypothetical protein